MVAFVLEGVEIMQKTKASIFLDLDLHKALKILAAENGQTIQGVVEGLVRHAVFGNKENIPDKVSLPDLKIDGCLEELRQALFELKRAHADEVLDFFILNLLAQAKAA